MLVNILVVLESHGFECVSADLFSHLLIQCSHKCTVFFFNFIFGTTRPFTTQASIYFTHIYTGDSVCITRCLLINWQKHSPINAHAQMQQQTSQIIIAESGS